jgi:CRP-like cAMP-binding protein
MLKKVSAAFVPTVFSVGDTIIKENESGNAIFVVVRGTVKVVLENEIVAIAGPGNVLGEIAALTGQTSKAGVVAESPVTVLKMKYLKLQRFLSEDRFLRENLWRIAARRIAENILSKHEPYNRMRRRKLKYTIEKGEVLHFEKDNFYKLGDKVGVLISGMAFKDGKLTASPLIVEESEIQLVGDSYLFVF